jgi:hypothetical protein
MKKKTSRTARKDSLLPAGWTLPAFADRRAKPRPARETAAQRRQAAARRRKP